MASRRSQHRTTTVQPGLIPGENGRTKLSSGKTDRLKKGLFITFEGGEGAGKTTQANRLAARMIELGLDVYSTREPGGTDLGEQIRSIVKGESEVGTIAETLLFAAARAQLVGKVIRPRLRRKSIVIVDRFIDSTVAYQGYGRGMDIDQINTLNLTATGGILPDLTVLLDAEPQKTLSRVEVAPSLFQQPGNTATTRDGDREEERRFEREPLSFHEEVRHGYHELAKEGGRWCVIRADQAQHRVADAIWKRVRPLLIERGVDAELLTRKQGIRAK